MQPITPETEALVQQHGGPLAICGQQGQYILMRSDVYVAMLGMDVDEESATLSSIRRGLADMESGRTQDLDDAFDELDTNDAP